MTKKKKMSFFSVVENQVIDLDGKEVEKKHTEERQIRTTKSGFLELDIQRFSQLSRLSSFS